MNYFEKIFSVSNSREDQQDEKEKRSADDRQINRFVLQEIGIGKDITPVDRWRKNNETTGKRRQMSRETLCLVFIGQRSDLRRDGERRGLERVTRKFSLEVHLLSTVDCRRRRDKDKTK